MVRDVTLRKARRPWGAATVWCLVLAVLFFATYNATNWFTAQRASVGVMAFDWERHIPFLPWTIVPYWSIDLLYGVSLFICTTRYELTRHALRLLCAQLICIAGFLLFPLRFSFDRPATDGFFGLMFDTLAGFDRPFNQAPSLHICLLVILWYHYARHVRSTAGKLVLHGWFALIGISVLTTYQHHFVDLVAGVWAGLLCLFIVGEDVPAGDARGVPNAGRRWRATHGHVEPGRRRLARIYAVGSAFCLLPAFSGYLPAWLAWPVAWAGAALMLVAAIYAWGEGAHFGVKQGRRPWWLRALLAPYLLGARVNVWWWTMGLPAHVPITEGISLGRMPLNARELEQGRFDSVLNVSAELSCPASNIGHDAHPMLDLLPPRADQLEVGADKLEALRRRGTVLVCCALGFSRSAAVIAAWLVRYRHVPAADAVRSVQGRRPQVVLSAEVIARLQQVSVIQA
ncbi:phosphatase PAP2/dual specificity phosphatase family protein [Uliginosibacterium sp. H3]|uniref:Phosphatase PAP2/dual specificity phosphatase family protein n=1 Tax=Uliginosibacterium silvisoli TaxID=3114758 RepID=A0ABU6K0C2_9RHOO|nr:phosphatase PAP2/dual specificity phosphatase family protein [Uliginosibacterium sp. H3]